MRTLRFVLRTATALAAALLAACAGTPPAPDAGPAGSASAPSAAAAPQTTSGAATESLGAGAIVEQFGVQLKGVRLTANGYIVDVRYRVLDPVKAQPLLDRKVRPTLVDEATGDRFYVPTPPIIGALRQTTRNKTVHTDRDYFMLFANPNRKLQAGSKVTLYVGDQRFGNLLVEAGDAVAANAPQPAR